MSSKAKNTTAILIICLFAASIQAQHRYDFGILPSLNIKHKLDKKWGLNFKIESQQKFKSGNFENKIPFKYQYSRTDLTLMADRKVRLSNKFAAGYMYRRSGTSNIHRFIQQFSFNKKYDAFRLSQRLAADQTLQSSTSPILRFRYRLATEIPLSGDQLDSKEFYFKINQEQLHIFQKDVYDLELRLVPNIGYAINKHHKIEAGLNYRFSGFFTDKPRSQFWWALNWYFVF